jgi:hypothetical protein
MMASDLAEAKRDAGSGKRTVELTGRSVYVAGHRGMVGSALVRRLAREDVKLVTVDRRVVDLCKQAAVFDWFARTRPQVIFLAAAKVGASSPTPRCAPSSSTTTSRSRPM